MSLADHYAAMCAPPFVQPRLVVVMRSGFVGWLPTDMAAEQVGGQTDLEIQQMWEYELAVAAWLV